jgi:hypothetical protein
MPVLEPPLSLTCFEPRRRLSAGRSRPILAACTDEEGAEFLTVLKLRQPDRPYNDGHFGGTSLAAELICSALGRAVGLAVPDYAIVNVSSDVLAGVANPELRALLSANLGLNFGALYHEGFTMWSPRAVSRATGIFEGMQHVLAFDALVINGDRQALNPNLLVRGDELLAIDHSLALPIHRWAPADVAASPFLPESSVRQHSAFPVLTRRSPPCATLPEAWKATITDDELTRLRSWIPPSWEHTPGHLDTMFGFLTARRGRVDAVAAELRRILR